MQKNNSSFKDPSGHVYMGENHVYRTVNNCYKQDWALLDKQVFFKELVEEGKVIPFTVIENSELFAEDPNVFLVLQSEKLPFISYPYEWSFSQLKEAALLTLELQKRALENGFILKDASAFNVQFHNNKPIFIDLLSFEKLTEGQTWQAYGQFCQHFLAPLALMAKSDIRWGLISKLWLDGIPLDLASKLLPKKTYLSLALYLHIHLHAKMKLKHSDSRKSLEMIKKAKMTLAQLKELTNSLIDLVSKLKLKKQNTEWSDYYNDTNYSEDSRQIKIQAIENIAKKYTGKLAIDLGANNGFFSKLLCPSFDLVLACDIDPLAVEQNFHNFNEKNMLPLVLDFTNPSPGIGFGGIEREAFHLRCKADLALSLALIHHLRISGNLPFNKIAQYHAELLNKDGILVIEFIEKNDSQIKRLLSTRDDVFADYSKDNFIKQFSDLFSLLEEFPIQGTNRILFTFKKI